MGLALYLRVAENKNTCHKTTHTKNQSKQPTPNQYLTQSTSGNTDEEYYSQTPWLLDKDHKGLCLFEINIPLPFCEHELPTEQSILLQFYLHCHSFSIRLLWFGDRGEKKKQSNPNKQKKKRTQKRKLEVLTLISKAIFIQEWGIRLTHSRGIPIFTIFILTPNFISVVHNLEQLSYTLPPFLQLARINSCFTRLLHIINWNKKLLNNNRTTVTAKKTQPNNVLEYH